MVPLTSPVNFYLPPWYSSILFKPPGLSLTFGWFHQGPVINIDYIIKYIAYIRNIECVVIFQNVKRGDLLFVQVIGHVNELVSLVKVQATMGFVTRDLHNAYIKVSNLAYLIC